MFSRFKGLLYCFFFFVIFSNAQDLPYTRNIIDTLCSPGMHGRGYVNEGDKIAAKYIASQFQNFKLTSFGSSYFQQFHLPVNTFPSIVKVKINNKELGGGKDFIVQPST